MTDGIEERARAFMASLFYYSPNGPKNEEERNAAAVAFAKEEVKRERSWLADALEQMATDTGCDHYRNAAAIVRDLTKQEQEQE